MDTLGPDARRTLLEVLACVVHADDEVADEERAAHRGACVALGLSDAPAPYESDVDALSFEHLSRREAMLTYAGAAWMTLADGLLMRAESLVLSRLRRRLRLDEATARFLSAQARWVRATSELPWHREIDLLLTETARRLAQVEAHRRAA